MASVLAFGDLMVEMCLKVHDHLSVDPDLIATEYLISCGGSAANFAACLGRLEFDVKLLSHTGTDLHSEMLIAELRDSNVRVTDIARLPGGASLTTIIIGPGGERRFVSYRNPIEPLPEDDDFDALLVDVDWVHISGFVFQRKGSGERALNLIRKARDRGIPLSIDPSPHFAQAIIRDRDRLLPLIDYLFPNEYEAHSLTGIKDPRRAAESLVNFGVGTVVVTLGASGAIICTGGNITSVPAEPTNEMCDSTGAGDALAAGFVAATLRSASPKAAVRVGAYLAAGVIAEIGGHCGAPTLAELKKIALTSPQASDALEVLF